MEVTNDLLLFYKCEKFRSKRGIFDGRFNFRESVEYVFLLGIVIKANVLHLTRNLSLMANFAAT